MNFKESFLKRMKGETNPVCLSSSYIYNFKDASRIDHPLDPIIVTHSKCLRTTLSSFREEKRLVIPFENKVTKKDSFFLTEPPNQSELGEKNKIIRSNINESFHAINPNLSKNSNGREKLLEEQINNTRTRSFQSDSFKSSRL